MNRFKLMIAALCLAILPGWVHAKVELPAIFTDNMVLQQQTEAPVWGKAAVNKEVKITTSWDNQTYRVMAGPDGKWSAKLKTPVAGGPYQITISDGKDIKLNNVLIGEVWVCSGQSNMEMPLAGWGKIDRYEQEIAAANYPQIRLLHVEKATSTQPSEAVKIAGGGWQVCSPANIPDFSSVAYFFGRELHKSLNVPIGLINTSWGGTIAEAWTSEESLENMPYFNEAVQKMRTVSETELQATYQKKIDEWNQQVESADGGIAGNWKNPGLDDKDWKTMQIPVLWEDAGLKDFDGIVWFRKTVHIASDWSGKELEFSIGTVDDNDITYFNGVEIGRTNGYGLTRNYKVPARLVKPGKAVITVRVTDTGGGGGILGEKNSLKISGTNNKVGEKTIDMTGEWKYNAAVDLSKFSRAPQSQMGNPNRPTVLFNAMIKPLVPYAIQGAIWYQGESNADRPYQYRELFPLMIRDWRTQWNRDFPFYFVQLANFMAEDKEPAESQWAELREAQLQTLHLGNTGMAVTIDIGDAKDIHPKNKQDVGLRLALAAKANTYGQKIVYSGPVYDSYRIEGNQIRIFFKHTEGGLKIKDGTQLKGFAIAGSDHKFYWAQATIERNEVVVSAPQVKFPVAVRYAWGNNPVCNLCNGADLPASPFRTDDWRQQDKN